MPTTYVPSTQKRIPAAFLPARIHFYCSIAIMKDDSFNFVTAIGSAFSNARHTFRDVQLPTEATTISECSETYPLHAFRDM